MGKVISIVPLPSVKPVCFESEEQWQEWQRWHKVAGPLAKGEHYCTDCSEVYQRQMKQRNRCGYPDVQFFDDEGFRPGQLEKASGNS